MVRYTDEELLNQIHQLADGDTPPTINEFDDHPETADSTTVHRRFGSWNEAVRAAGYPSGEHVNTQYTDEELLDQIHQLADGDTPPTTKQFDNHSETADSTTVHRRFGSWNEAVRAAGYSAQYTKKDLLAALQQAVATDNIDQIVYSETHNYPDKSTYARIFGGITVAALRGSIDIGRRRRTRAVPLTKEELHKFVGLIPQLDPRDQAISMVALLTGCADSEHKWVGEGIEDTETDSAILFPAESERGNRSVAIGPLYSQFVRRFDAISTERLRQAVEYSSYPPARVAARTTLTRIAERIEFDMNNLESRTAVLHRDLRCTHYLFEFCHGASKAMLKRRLALSDNKIEHFHRFLNEDEESWSVRIEWRD